MCFFYSRNLFVRKIKEVTKTPVLCGKCPVCDFQNVRTLQGYELQRTEV